MNITYIIFGAIGIALLGAGIGLGYYIRQLVAQKRKSSIEARLKKLIEDSKVEAKEILFDAKEKAAKTAEETKIEEKERHSQMRRLEERVLEREAAIDKRVFDHEKRTKELEERIERVKSAKTEIEAARESALKELERISGLTKEDAMNEVMAKIEKEYTIDLMARVKKLEQGGMEELERRAKNILATLIQRLSTSTTSEVTTTTVQLPSDDLKGKIILVRSRK